MSQIWHIIGIITNVAKQNVYIHTPYNVQAKKVSYNDISIVGHVLGVYLTIKKGCACADIEYGEKVKCSGFYHWDAC